MTRATGRILGRLRDQIGTASHLAESTLQRTTPEPAITQGILSLIWAFALLGPRFLDCSTLRESRRDGLPPNLPTPTQFGVIVQARFSPSP